MFARKHGKKPTPFPALNEILLSWDELFREIKKNDEKKQSNSGPDISAREKEH